MTKSLSPQRNFLVPFIFSIITGVLLGLSALPSDFWFLGFIAFIPMLIASEMTLDAKKPILIFALQILIALCVFYLWVGSWILQTASLGFLFGLLIVLPFVILLSPYILFKKRKNKFAIVYFIAAWLTVELFQTYFQLGSPFYNLGNNLGAAPELIQWYEYTGAAGGTLWILAVNFALFSLGKALLNDRRQWIRKSFIALGIMLIPVIFSILIFNTYKEKGSPAEVLIIHPSTDCHNVKYQINIYELMDIYLGILLPQLNENTEYVVLPETALTNGGWVTDFDRNLVFDHFNKSTANFPNLKLVTGAITYEAIPNVEKIKGYRKMPGIRFSEKYKVWYYTYNAALQIGKNLPVQMRTKEGLVPYQEYAPYPLLLPHISPVGINFQFSARNENQQVFQNEKGEKTAAMVCYELVYGNKFSKAAREGAEAFFVLLNEGWYTKIPKVKHQFIQLSAIRAIENRRDVAHSSNMGISAFIDQRGKVLARQESAKPGFLKQVIRMNKKNTMASMLGNYPGILALFTVLLMSFNQIIHAKPIIHKN